MTPSSTFNASDGDAYERMMGRWSRRLAEPFLDFAGPVADGRILDVGCGTGSLTLALARRSPTCHVQGLDFSADYVAAARRRTDDPRLAFRQGDACAMPFADAAFDQVLSLLMLHFVPRAPEAIAEMRRVARPGATVAAAVWDARSMVAHRIVLDTAAVLDAEGDARRAQSLVRPMTRPGELGAAWRAAGFRDVRDTTLAIRMEFAGFDDFWSPYLGGQGPGGGYVTGLDPAARERLQEHVRRAYVDGEEDGPRSYTASAWAVRGTVPDRDRRVA